MIVICTLDKNNGLLFNRRRLSQDIVVTTKIADLAKDKVLAMDPLSFPLFTSIDVQFKPQCLGEDSPAEYKFIEFENPMNYDPDELYVFRWDRKYPSDVKVNLEGFKKEKIEEFSGYSHEKIILERYYK